MAAAALWTARYLRPPWLDRLYLQDRLRVWRRGNVQKVLELAHEKLEGSEEEAKPVEPKLLFQVLEKASLEDDDYLRDKWASLLASAATGRKVHPSFVSILSQLSPDEARILDGPVRATDPKSFSLRSYHEPEAP